MCIHLMKSQYMFYKTLNKLTIELCIVMLSKELNPKSKKLHIF